MTAINIYATPDGQNSPLNFVGSAPAGSTEFTDTTTEAALMAKPSFGGAAQPAQEGSCTITVRKDGNRWFVLSLKDGASNYVDGLSVAALPEGAVITADVDNSLPEGELSVFID